MLSPGFPAAWTSARHDFAEQFLGLASRDGKSFGPGWGRPIEFTYRPAIAFFPRNQIAPCLKPAEHRVERAGAYPVAMTRQFIDHPLAIQLALQGMMQNVETNEAAQQIVMFQAEIIPLSP
jgi:hypothetical protein